MWCIKQNLNQTAILEQQDTQESDIQKSPDEPNENGDEKEKEQEELSSAESVCY